MNCRVSAQESCPVLTVVGSEAVTSVIVSRVLVLNLCIVMSVFPFSLQVFQTLTEHKVMGSDWRVSLDLPVSDHSYSFQLLLSIKLFPSQLVLISLLLDSPVK